MRLAEEEEAKKGIRQRQIEKMLKAKEREDQKELNFRFHANAVPWYVTEPLYDRINREKEERRLQLKEEVKRRMLDDARVLHKFEKLAKAKEREWEPAAMEEFNIRARPVPKSSSLLLYDQLLFDKKQRSEQNIEERKAELKASVPGGVQKMFERQEESRKRHSQSPYHKAGCLSGADFTQFKAREMPDFERLHQELEDEFQAKKVQFHPTVPYELGITNVNKKPADYSIMNYDNYAAKKNFVSNVRDIEDRLRKI